MDRGLAHGSVCIGRGLCQGVHVLWLYRYVIRSMVILLDIYWYHGWGALPDIP